MKNLPTTIVERPKLNGALFCSDFLWDGMRVLYIETIPIFQGFVACIRVLPPFQQVSITKHPSNRFLVEIMLPHSLRASQRFAVRISYWKTFCSKCLANKNSRTPAGWAKMPVVMARNWRNSWVIQTPTFLGPRNVLVATFQERKPSKRSD